MTHTRLPCAVPGAVPVPVPRPTQPAQRPQARWCGPHLASAGVAVCAALLLAWPWGPVVAQAPAPAQAQAQKPPLAGPATVQAPATLAERPAPRPAATPDRPPAVAMGAAMVAIPDPASRQQVVRGVVRAVGEATLSSRLAARISRLPLGEGEAFRQGEVLVEFDCERPRAEARAASAAVEAQRKTVETNEELDKFNAIGKNDLLVSRAQLDRVRAESEALQSQVRECAVLAPFDGRVMARMARAHESVQMGQPLLKVADTSDLELELIVPSPWLSWLKPGTPFQFRVDETGRVLQAQLSRVGAAVDPISRTVRVMARFAKQDAVVLPGMSGTGSFAGRGRSSP